MCHPESAAARIYGHMARGVSIMVAPNTTITGSVESARECFKPTVELPDRSTLAFFEVVAEDAGVQTIHQDLKADTLPGFGLLKHAPKSSAAIYVLQQGNAALTEMAILYSPAREALLFRATQYLRIVRASPGSLKSVARYLPNNINVPVVNRANPVSVGSLRNLDGRGALRRPPPTPVSRPSIVAGLINEDKLIGLVLRYPMMQYSHVLPRLLTETVVISGSR